MKFQKSLWSVLVAVVSALSITACSGGSGITDDPGGGVVPQPDKPGSINFVFSSAFTEVDPGVYTVKFSAGDLTAVVNYNSPDINRRSEGEVSCPLFDAATQSDRKWSYGIYAAGDNPVKTVHFVVDERMVGKTYQIDADSSVIVDNGPTYNVSASAKIRVIR